MRYDDARGLQTPERFERGNERLTDCPVCGTPIDGLDADARTTVEPCGHSAAGLTTETMTRDTTSDANRVMTDGGDPDHVPVLLVAYEDDADPEYDHDGDEVTVENHDELVNSGQTFDEIRMLNRESVEKFDMNRIKPGHPLWCGEVAELEPGESIRVDELRGEGDAE